jgi:hypothetical protein
MAGVALFSPMGVGAAHAQGEPRLQAVINQNGAIIRSVGVRRVNNPQAGVYCIRPRANAGLDLNDIYPSLTILAQPGNPNHGIAAYSVEPVTCPANTIEVRTSLLLSPGSLEPTFFATNRGFVIVVD